MSTKAIIKVDNISRRGVIAIRLSNGTSIIRTQRQFILDLQNSTHLPDNGEDLTDDSVVARLMQSGRVRRALRSFTRGTVEGDFKFHKAGDTYTATEKSKAVLDKTAEVGDELTYEKDGYRVEGFLNLQYSERAEQMLVNAELAAEMSAELFSSYNSNSNDDQDEDSDDDQSEMPVIDKRTPAKAQTKGNGAKAIKALKAKTAIGANAE